MKPITMLLMTVILTFATAASAQQSTDLKATLPAAVKVNTNVNLSAKLSDAWTGQALPGRSVEIGVGDQYSMTSTPFPTSNTGVSTRSWRFTKPGKYRIVFRQPGGGFYLDSRTTVFVTDTN
ncbi:MAG: hypothetical protein AABP62_24225 [Planctomycetota bacterium]